ncbi:MAG: hypothetical protein LBP54_07345 [Campylobacteraceae bacterium]|nr:hypothetical protein [Campylobacteraceae bacterium]
MNINNSVECNKNNPTNGVFSANSIIRNSDFLIENSYIGDSSISSDIYALIFPLTALANKELISHSIEKCYTDDITSEIQPYINSLIDADFDYDNGLYIKTVGNNKYIFGYKQKAIFWGYVKKELNVNYNPYSCP